MGYFLVGTDEHNEKAENGRLVFIDGSQTSYHNLITFIQDGWDSSNSLYYNQFNTISEYRVWKI